MTPTLTSFAAPRWGFSLLEAARRRLTMNLRSSFAAVVLFAAFGASAQPAPVTNSRMVPAQVQPGADATLDERQAREWGLRSEEWARYRQLMQGPLGVYSPQLDPLTALGIEARSEEERRRYAELQVQAEALRVGKIGRASCRERV